GKMEARIRQLQTLLAEAVVIEGGELSTDTVTPGVVVTLRYDGDDEDDTLEYLVGSIEEKRPGVEVVSPTSPLGQALLGAKVGHTVEYQAPGGLLKVHVVGIGA
ncbi:MAG: GreA/GreB family elongation factor, partial [Acidimicrobiales bacterium]